MAHAPASGFVYIWFDRLKKRFYVGSHWGAEDDGYVCSSNWMKKAYKHRPQDFKRRILSRVNTTRDDLLKEEQRWLDMIKLEEIRKSEKSRYYNLNLKTAGWWIDDHSRKTIGEKISIGVKKAFQDPKIRSNYESGQKNRKPITPEARKRQGKSMKAYWDEGGHRDVMSSEENRAKVSRGTKEAMSRPEVKAKLSEGQKNRTDSRFVPDPDEYWKDKTEDDKIAHGKKISKAKRAKGTSSESRERYRQAALKREAAKRISA